MTFVLLSVVAVAKDVPILLLVFLFIVELVMDSDLFKGFTVFQRYRANILDIARRSSSTVFMPFYVKISMMKHIVF